MMEEDNQEDEVVMFEGQSSNEEGNDVNPYHRRSVSNKNKVQQMSFISYLSSYIFLMLPDLIRNPDILYSNY